MDVFGLIGNPVGHSLSPVMHEVAYDELGLEARYCAFEPARDELATAVAGADALGVRGLNVTIPFKQDVLSLVEPDDLASRIGAVNTIDFGDDVGDGDGGVGGDGGDGGDGDSSDGGDGSGVPTGHNTDAVGAVRSFEAHDVDLSGTAVVVGAGGAGRAVAFGLAAEGTTVRVANRTVGKAERLAADVATAPDDAPGASGHGLDELGTLLADASVLVNCTSVGMESDATPVPREALHADLAVLDAVYAPIETRLLREASAAGATTIDGAWMLLFQGVAAFERWTGHDAPVDAMNDALRAKL